MSFEAQLARDLLLVLDNNLAHAKPLLEEWVDYYRKTAQPEIFKAHEGNRAGGGGHLNWRRLTVGYLRSSKKRSSVHPRDILQLTGDFRKDLTTGTGFTFERFNISAGSAEVAFGTLREYPRYIGAGQGGSRQAMYITARTQREFVDITNHFISKAIVQMRSKAQSLTPKPSRVP